MKPIFTIHAGEYLVGDFLEKQFSNCEIWVPSKDTGTDLLITNSLDRKKNAGIQVKFSKDFLPEMEATFHSSLSACGWWTLNPQKIQTSNAELWILAPYSFIERRIQFIIIEPEELSERLDLIHGKPKTMNVYLWVTKDGKCFETRGLSKTIQKEIVNGKYSSVDKNRDFTNHLNAWNAIESRVY
ncbi:MAG: hypothetical protein PHI97_29180 [Desulfobulbus sp.]|nr:hypothetical protein [Desulfobulbus sp.]